MNLPSLLATAFIGITALNSPGALVQWQAAVTAGPATASTLFTTTSAPRLFNVGTLTGDRAFEFIVNAETNTVASALLGAFGAAGGNQALKFEQYNNTGFMGFTAFGVEDYTSNVTTPTNLDVHLVFTFDGTKTDLYVDGEFGVAFTTAPALAITGEVGLGGAWNPATSLFVDALPGSILGFASYDTALTGAQILTHYNAFAQVPEAGSAALMMLAFVGAVSHRQRRILS